MKKFISKALSCALVFAMMLQLTACGGGGASSSSKTSTGAAASGDKMFNIVMTAAFSGFDPLRTNDAASTYVTSQIYETLYRIGNDGSFIPVLAAALPEFTADGKCATIKLREGVKFQDGTPFNAEAVKYTFELIKNPDFGSARASLAASIDTIEVVDDNTVKFNLRYEDGVLTAKLAHTNSAIVSPTAQAKQDLMINPVGTGPYKFVSSISGSNVVLTRNDEYWGKAPIIKDVTMTVITEEATALARMETGEADFMPTLSVEGISRVEAMKNVNMGMADSAQLYYMALRPTSYKNPLMANKDFRTAIIKSLDREGYVKYILEGHGQPTNSIIGPKVFGYTEAAKDKCIGFDLEGAKELVTKNGWANEEILLLVPSTPVYTPMGEYYQANLKAAGFNNVKLESIEWSAWLTESKTENRFDITVAAWSNVTRDGTELLEPNWATSKNSRTKINDAKFDELVNQGKMTANKESRVKALEAANVLLMENGYAAPLYNAEQRYVYSKSYNAKVDTNSAFYLADFTLAQ